MIQEHQLRQIPALQELSSDELASLHSVLKERRVPKGSFIVYVDDPGRSMMFLADGQAKVVLMSRDGKEIVVTYLFKGEFFGEIALLTGEDRSANVVAVTDCMLFVLEEQDFAAHISKYPGLSFAMLRVLAQRLRASSQKIGDLALYDVYRRVARTLKALSSAETVNGEERHIIKVRPTHQELSSVVGTSREMVTRALKGLEEDGYIELVGKQIIVKNVPL